MYIVFDIGGTNMRLAASVDGDALGQSVILPTPKNFEAGVAQLATEAKKLVANAAITAVAGGIAGPLDQAKARVVAAPNLSDWSGQPLKKRLVQALAAPVYLENDTAMVGLGEATVGAGRGAAIVAYLTVSTGVGGARIVDGRVDRSAQGFEPGHQIIVPDGLTCNCGRAGHLEAYVSGTAFAKRFGKAAHEVSDPSAWEQAAKLLAIGLNNTIVHWSPDVVVLGGRMMTGNPRIPIEQTAEHLKGLLTIFPRLPALKIAVLGDIGGLRGALVYLKQLAR